MECKPEHRSLLKVEDVSLGAVLGKPGTGMSYAVNDIVKNFAKNHPDAVPGTVIDKGESFRSDRSRLEVAPAQMSDEELQQAILACTSPSTSGKAETAFNYLQSLQHELQRRESRKLQAPSNPHARRAKASKDRQSR